MYSCYVTPQPGPIPSRTRGGFREADDPEDTDAPEYIFELPDKVESRFRYYLVDGHAVAHFRVPNRDILDNPQLSLQTCAERVTSRFSTPYDLGTYRGCPGYFPWIPDPAERQKQCCGPGSEKLTACPIARGF